MLRDDQTAAQILRARGLELDSVRDELARSPAKMPSSAYPGTSGGHPWVANADTAVKIAEAVLTSIVGAEAVESARPYEAFAAGHQWVVRGAPSSDDDPERLTALIEQNGRIIFVGKGSGRHR